MALKLGYNYDTLFTQPMGNIAVYISIIVLCNIHYKTDK